MYTAEVMEDKLMKCVDCDLKQLQERKCGCNRYHCEHPDAPRQNITKNMVIVIVQRKKIKIIFNTESSTGVALFLS